MTSPVRLLSVQCALARRMRIGERDILTGIDKRPVAGPVAVGRMGLEGDEQADLSVHGGLDKSPTAHREAETAKAHRG